jgi:hypothetical protein
MIPHVISKIRVARDQLSKLLKDSGESSVVSEECATIITDAHAQVERANDLLQDMPVSTRNESDDDSVSSDATEY